MRNGLHSLAETEIWIVSLLVFSSLVFERLLPVAVAVAALFWGVRWIANGKSSRRTPADLPVLLLVLLIPVSLWITVVPEVTRTQVFRLLTGIAIFYAIINWGRSYARLRLLSLGIVVLGLALAGFALVSVAWGESKLAFIPPTIYQLFPPRISDTINPNVIAGSLVLVLPCILAFALSSWHSYNLLSRCFAAAAAILVLAVLVLTQSRGAWFALAVAAVALAIMRWRLGWIVMAVAAVCVVVFVYFRGAQPLLETVLAGTSVGSLEERLGVWSRAVLILRNTPLTGIGMGSFAVVADKLYPFSLTESGKIAHTHNLFLQVAVDMGIPGIVCWLAVLSTGIAAAWNVYRRGREEYSRAHWHAGMGAGLLCSQLALIVHGLTDAVTWGMVRPAPLVWVIWGFAVSFWMVSFPSVRGHSLNTREE